MVQENNDFPDIDYTLLPNEGTATIAGFDVVTINPSAVVLAICQESFHCIRI
jgi:hypothetical protein